MADKHNSKKKILKDVGYGAKEEFCDLELEDGTIIKSKERKLEAEWILAQSMLSELKPVDSSFETWERRKDDFLDSRISFETWERYYKENPIEKEDKRLKNFVLDDSKLPQRLDHAVGKIKINDKYFRYYGAKINEIILKGQKGGMIQTTQLSPAIILENGLIITENNKPEDVNFVFDSVMTLKRNRWSLSSIKQFCEGKVNKEDYTFEKIFESFKKFYQESMVFEDEQWYNVLAIRDQVTYFWDMIDKFIFIKREGISGVAKSKGMKIGANLTFNGKKFLCPTPANFFRYRHHNKATLFIEEAERLFDDSKKKNNADSELVEYLNGSYEKGNTVPRQNDKDINQTDEFDPAGFGDIGSIAPLKGALEKRSVPLHMIKAPKNDPRGNVEIPTENDLRYCQARDEMYLCGLLNYKEFEKALNEVQNNYNLANREWILAKPLIALASCISNDLEKQVGKFFAGKFEVRDDFFDDNSWERKMATNLIEIFCNKSDGSFVSTNEIKFQFLQKIGGDYKISTHRISKIINELGFSDYKTRNSAGNERGYNLSFFKLCEILIRNDWTTIENILKIVSELSECQYSNDKINKWYTDTFLTLDTFNKKNKEISDTLTDLTLYLGVDKEKLTSKFSDSELKKAGYSDEEIKDFHKEGVL